MQYFCVSSMLFCGTKNPARHSKEGTLTQKHRNKWAFISLSFICFSISFLSLLFYFVLFYFILFFTLLQFVSVLRWTGGIRAHFHPSIFLPFIYYQHDNCFLKFWSILVNIRPPFGFVMVTVWILLHCAQLFTYQCVH